MGRQKLLAALAAVLAGGVAFIAQPDAAAPQARIGGSAPCAAATAKPPVAPGRYTHVIWIFMENHSYSDVIGNPSAPFLNSIAKKCGLATNYTAITHPSLPNYIAATSGNDWGIRDDASPGAHRLRVPNLFAQLTAKRLAWRYYGEDAPAGCPRSSRGQFAVHHDPSAYYTALGLGCARGNVPLGSSTTGAFARALRGSSFPAFAFVTPNNCNNMHDCSVATGDRWLSTWVSLITRSRTYVSGKTVLFVTWDEDDRSDGNHVATMVVSPTTPAGTQSAIPFTHYSLLRTTESLLGLGFVGKAKTARSMRAAFHL